MNINNNIMTTKYNFVRHKESTRPQIAFHLTSVTHYIPCFFWSSTSSFHSVLTASIMTWTSCTSE